MLIIRSITIYIHSYIASIRLFIPPFSVLHTPTPKKTLLTLRHFAVCRRRYMCWLLCSTTQHSRSTYIWTNNQRVWWWPAASAFNVITERAEHIYIGETDWVMLGDHHRIITSSSKYQTPVLWTFIHNVHSFPFHIYIIQRGHDHDIQPAEYSNGALKWPN